MVDFLPLVDCMERRLSASSCFLNQGGKLQLLNSVISSMPIYYLCSLHIPVGIIKQLERIQRQCLWRRYDKDSGKSLASWDLVCRPKRKGGWGVINLSIQNEALLLKQLHNFYNRVQVPWVQLIWNTYYHNRIPHAIELYGSFWWKDICQLLDKFIVVSNCTFGDGITALFWLDNWRDNQQQLLAHNFARLFSFAKDSLISVHEVLQTDELLSLFHLPLSTEAYGELQLLSQIVVDYLDRDQTADVWSWGFGKG